MNTHILKFVELVQKVVQSVLVYQAVNLVKVLVDKLLQELGILAPVLEIIFQIFLIKTNVNNVLMKDVIPVEK